MKYNIVVEPHVRISEANLRQIRQWQEISRTDGLERSVNFEVGPRGEIASFSEPIIGDSVHVESMIPSLCRLHTHPNESLPSPQDFLSCLGRFVVLPIASAPGGETKNVLYGYGAMANNDHLWLYQANQALGTLFLRYESFVLGSEVPNARQRLIRDIIVCTLYVIYIEHLHCFFDTKTLQEKTANLDPLWALQQLRESEPLSRAVTSAIEGDSMETNLSATMDYIEQNAGEVDGWFDSGVGFSTEVL